MDEKLRRLMKHEGINSTRLAEILGIQASGISHIMSGRNKPSYDFLIKLLQRFPQINPDWLLLDKGPMYRDEVKNKTGGAVQASAVVQTGQSNPAMTQNLKVGEVGLFAGSSDSTGATVKASVMDGGIGATSGETGRMAVAARQDRSNGTVGVIGGNGRFGPDDDDIIPSVVGERQYPGFARSGSIERIVVFNKDKTFSEYQPE